ncbi:MAG: YebC/PmpR family DNA-binding transcriptional regulator [Bacilli bacterium]|nr:YebC/PmpR family DNA-binding transcriptional regulator [Bacilli bacterium]
MKLNIQLFGRAYEVRKASIQKTGAAKAKLYSMYAREIYDIAKKGGTDPNSNASLKRIMERAKKEQVPADIIKRAIDKVNSGVDESYEKVSYEIFGPAGSTLIVECLTDNVNRSISSVKAALNKCKCKIGVQGSVSFNYDNLCIIGFKGISEEEAMDAIIEDGLDIDDIESDGDMVIIYGNPKDLHALKSAIEKIKNVEFEIDEISMIPKDKITISGEDKEIFDRLLNMLEDIEDVKDIYHNVEQ